MNDMNNEGVKGKDSRGEGWFLKFRRELREKKKDLSQKEFTLFAEKIRDNAAKDSSWAEFLEALPDEVVEQFKEAHEGLHSQELSSKELAGAAALSELWDARNKDQMGDIPVDIKGITASYFDMLSDGERPLEGIKALPMSELTNLRKNQDDRFSVLTAWKAMLPK